MTKRRSIDTQVKRARRPLSIGVTVLFVMLGSYVLYSMWQLTQGQPPQALVQEARDYFRVGDHVRAAVFIDRARKKTSDPELTRQLDELYRKIVIKQRIKVVEGLMASRRYAHAKLQLISILEETPDNHTVSMMLRTVETALSALKEKRSALGAKLGPTSARAVGR